MSLYLPHAIGLLQPIQTILDDKTVSEICVNRPHEIWFEQSGKFINQHIPAFSEVHLLRLFQLIANENQQRLCNETPLLSGSLMDGTRVQLCLPPTAKYPTLSIRRKVVQQLSLSDYEQMNFYSHAIKATLNDSKQYYLNDSEKKLIRLYQTQQWSAFMKTAITQKKTIVISGGTSSGKTTFLTACLHHIPLQERIILLEDTREIETPHPNQVQLLAVKGGQGEANITMQDLVECALRLRPDRIIMGEIRGKEMLDFISSCSTGHEGSMTSIHANNPAIAFMRMTQLYKLNHVPSMTDADILRELKAVIDIIIQLSKTRHGRQVDSIYYKYGDVDLEPER